MMSSNQFIVINDLKESEQRNILQHRKNRNLKKLKKQED